MVITSLQEKQNRKFYVPIRPGNRGGWSLFEWQSVREMPYRDRQMYLGNSAVIGVLDKGGKWRKRDWYLKTNKRYDDPNLTSQQQQAIKRDMERMNYALGNNQMEDDQKLTQQQMQELLKKIKNKDGIQQPSKQSIGLGFDKTKVQIRAKPGAGGYNPNRLEGIDELVEHESKPKKQHKQRKRNRSQNSEKQRSRSRDKQKKSKKLKKQKKDKKHKRDRQRSKSRQNERKQKRRDRSQSNDRKHKKQKSQKKHERRQRSSS